MEISGKHTDIDPLLPATVVIISVHMAAKVNIVSNCHPRIIDGIGRIITGMSSYFFVQVYYVLIDGCKDKIFCLTKYNGK